MLGEEWNFSVSGHSHESFSTRTNKDSVGDGFGGSVDNLSGGQLLIDAEATVMEQSGIKEVIAVAANESSYPYDPY